MKPLADATDEQVAAAQLRVVLDAKLGRETPDWIRHLAGRSPTSDSAPTTVDDPTTLASTDSAQTNRTALLSALGVEVSDDLLTLALTHRSYTYENGPTTPENGGANDRLELLGDAALGLVITHRLYTDHPDLTEADLAKLRASLINMNALADVARGLGEDGLGKHLLLGQGEENNGDRNRANVLADALEAVLGAVYLDRGLDVVRGLIHRLFEPLSADPSNTTEATNAPH